MINKIQDLTNNQIYLSKRYSEKVKENKDPNKSEETKFENKIWIFLYELLSEIKPLSFLNESLKRKENGDKINLSMNLYEAKIEDINYGLKKKVDTVVETNEMLLFIQSTITAEENLDAKIKSELTDFTKFKGEFNSNKSKNTAFIIHSKYMPTDQTLATIHKNGALFFHDSQLDFFIKFKEKYKKSNLRSLIYLQLLNFLFGPKQNPNNPQKIDIKPGDIIHCLKENNKDSKIEIDAIKGEDYNFKDFYVFNVNPFDILLMCNIPHRQVSTSDQKNLTFQRMIDQSKIEKIKEYINPNEEGVKPGGFPTNLIFNINHNVEFKDNNKLIIEKRYSTFSVIDGQHRLFSYLGENYNKKTTVTVTAFDGLGLSKQMKIFTDINEKQKPVDKNLMWDLYSDLYTENINDPQYDIRSARKCKISRFLKEINNDEEHPLYKCFNYDSSKFLKKESRFKLSNVGSFIEGKSSLFLNNTIYRTRIKEIFSLNSNSENELFYEDYEKLIFKTFFRASKDASKSWKHRWYNDNRYITTYILLLEMLWESLILDTKKQKPEQFTINIYKIFHSCLLIIQTKIELLDNKEYEDDFLQTGGQAQAKILKKLFKFLKPDYPEIYHKYYDYEDFENEISTIKKVLNTQNENIEFEAKLSYFIVPSKFEALSENKDVKLNPYKEAENEAKKDDGIRQDIAQVINAFSNTIGGKIVVGVEEKKKSFDFVGIHSSVLSYYNYPEKPEKLKKALINSIDKFFNDDVIFDIRIGDFNNKTFVIIDVEGISNTDLTKKKFKKFISPKILRGKSYYRNYESAVVIMDNDSTVSFVKKALKVKNKNDIEFERFNLSNENGTVLINKLPIHCPKCKTQFNSFEEAISNVGLRPGGKGIRIWQSYCLDCR